MTQKLNRTFENGFRRKENKGLPKYDTKHTKLEDDMAKEFGQEVPSLQQNL